MAACRIKNMQYISTILRQAPHKNVLLFRQPGKNGGGNRPQRYGPGSPGPSRMGPSSQLQARRYAGLWRQKARRFRGRTKWLRHAP